MTGRSPGGFPAPSEKPDRTKTEISITVEKLERCSHLSPSWWHLVRSSCMVSVIRVIDDPFSRLDFVACYPVQSMTTARRTIPYGCAAVCHRSFKLR